MDQDLQIAYEALSRVVTAGLETGDIVVMREAGLARAKTLELLNMVQHRESKQYRIKLNRTQTYCLSSL